MRNCIAVFSIGPMLFVADSEVVYDAATHVLSTTTNPPIKYNGFPWNECVVKCERGVIQNDILDENSDVIATVYVDGHIIIKHQNEVLVDWTPTSEAQLVDRGNQFLDATLDASKIIEAIAGNF